MALERDFHETIWKAANDYQAVEAALGQARELAKAVKNGHDDDLLVMLADDLLTTLGGTQS